MRTLLLTVLLGAAGCDVVFGLSAPTVDAAAGSMDARDALDATVSDACARGDFGVPALLGQLTGTPYVITPQLSQDRLEIYVTSFGPNGDLDLYRATRQSADAGFGALELAANLNSGTSERDPALTADGLMIMFTREQAGGGGRVFQATRPDVTAPWGAPVTPVELTGIGAIALDLSPDGLTLYFQQGYGTPLQAATRTSRTTPFSIPFDVGPEAWWPSVSPDGLDLYFAETDISAGFFHATRSAVSQPFGNPTQIETLGVEPDVSGDGDLLLFRVDDTLRYRERSCTP